MTPRCLERITKPYSKYKKQSDCHRASLALVCASSAGGFSSRGQEVRFPVDNGHSPEVKEARFDLRFARLARPQPWPRVTRAAPVQEKSKGPQFQLPKSEKEAIMRKLSWLLVWCILLLFGCIASAQSTSNLPKSLSCDDNGTFCTEVFDSIGYEGHYTGHDEP